LLQQNHFVAEDKTNFPFAPRLWLNPFVFVVEEIIIAELVVVYFLFVMVSQLLAFLCLMLSTSTILAGHSIVMTMILRDEAVNLRSNLPLWVGKIDYFMFLVDRRTTDGSEDVIKNILGDNHVPFEIVYHDFDGFGSSRTRSLQNAWKYFPQASHVWIADPDWKVDPNIPIQKSELDLIHDAFRFVIYDRNGQTTRRCDWLLRHREGLAMRYHLHEVLDIGHYEYTTVSWVVHEIEQKGSWHTSVGHTDSFSAQRMQFDLDLLYEDLEMYGHDPHTHKYLGVTHMGYAEKIFEANGNVLNEMIESHIAKGRYFLELRLNSTYENEFPEERWQAYVQLGVIAMNLKVL
jgi:hypothetical protein